MPTEFAGACVLTEVLDLETVNDSIKRIVEDARTEEPTKKH